MFLKLVVQFGKQVNVLKIEENLKIIIFSSRETTVIYFFQTLNGKYLKTAGDNLN